MNGIQPVLLKHQNAEIPAVGHERLTSAGTQCPQSFLPKLDQGQHHETEESQGFDQPGQDCTLDLEEQVLLCDWEEQQSQETDRHHDADSGGLSVFQHC